MTQASNWSNVLLPPFDDAALSQLRQRALEANGADPADTIRFLENHNSARELASAIGDYWSQTSLPLCKISRHIVQCGVFFDVENSEPAIAIATDCAHARFLIQQAPMDKAKCMKTLQERLTTVDPSIVDSFVAAPGLRIDLGPTLAHPSFLNSPCETMCKVSFGNDHTVENGILEDKTVYTPGTVGLEFCWDCTRPLQTDFVVFDRCGQLFLTYRDHYDELTELSIDPGEFVRSFYDNFGGIFDSMLSRVRRDGMVIRHFRPSADVRRQFARRSREDKIALLLRVIARALDRLRSMLAAQFECEQIVASCVQCMTTGSVLAASTVSQYCLGSQFNWNLRTVFCERLSGRYAAV